MVEFVHWNIKEFDQNIGQTPEHPQLLAAAAVLRKLRPEILSLNEIHDPGDSLLHPAPKLLEKAGLASSLPYRAILPANSGQRARLNPSGKYLQEAPAPGDRNLQYMDLGNFGCFPGQYAGYFASRYPILKHQCIRDLLWCEFAPERDLSHFNFQPADASSIELFDKSLNILTLDVDGVSLQVVCLHAVPAYEFGQKSSPNILRNGDQLRLLSWLVNGSNSISAQGLKKLAAKNIQPLSRDIPTILVGDFNCSPQEQSKPGAEILQQLHQNPNFWPVYAKLPEEVKSKHPELSMHTSFFAEGWDLGRSAQQLDYFFVSKHCDLERLEVYLPPLDLKDHGIVENEEEKIHRLMNLAGQGIKAAAIRMRERHGMRFRILSASEEFAELRAASDHLPLRLSFQLQHPPKLRG